jgi:chromosome segregation ATPase
MTRDEVVKGLLNIAAPCDEFRAWERGVIEAAIEEIKRLESVVYDLNCSVTHKTESISALEGQTERMWVRIATLENARIEIGLRVTEVEAQRDAIANQTDARIASLVSERSSLLSAAEEVLADRYGASFREHEANIQHRAWERLRVVVSVCKGKPTP